MEDEPTSRKPTTSRQPGRVAGQVRYGVGSVRMWVKQAAIDSGDGAVRTKTLDQENKEVPRVPETLKWAS